MSNYFSRNKRLKRRAVRSNTVYEKISSSVKAEKKSKLTTQNVGGHALTLVREMLGSYSLPRSPELSYSGCRHTRLAEKGDAIKDGVITIHASFKTNSGVNVAFEVPVEINDGELLEPSVIVHGGAPRIIAQSTFDNISTNNTIYDMVPVRDMYAAPMEHSVAADMYANRIKHQRASEGMFRQSENRNLIKKALRLGTDLEMAREAQIQDQQEIVTDMGDTHERQQNVAIWLDQLGEIRSQLGRVTGLQRAKYEAQHQKALDALAKLGLSSAEIESMLKRQSGGMSGRRASPEDYDADDKHEKPDPARNQQDMDCLDPSERKKQHDLAPGMEATLALDVEIKERGGVAHDKSKGTKCKILRDHAGDNKSFVVEFEDGLQSIVERYFLKSGSFKSAQATDVAPLLSQMLGQQTQTLELAKQVNQAIGQQGQQQTQQPGQSSPQDPAALIPNLVPPVSPVEQQQIQQESWQKEDEQAEELKTARKAFKKYSADGDISALKDALVSIKLVKPDASDEDVLRAVSNVFPKLQKGVHAVENILQQSQQATPKPSETKAPVTPPKQEPKTAPQAPADMQAEPAQMQETQDQDQAGASIDTSAVQQYIQSMMSKVQTNPVWQKKYGPLLTSISNSAGKDPSLPSRLSAIAQSMKVADPRLWSDVGSDFKKLMKVVNPRGLWQKIKETAKDVWHGKAPSAYGTPGGTWDLEKGFMVPSQTPTLQQPPQHRPTYQSTPRPERPQMSREQVVEEQINNLPPAEQKKVYSIRIDPGIPEGEKARLINNIIMRNYSKGLRTTKRSSMDVVDVHKDTIIYDVDGIDAHVKKSDGMIKVSMMANDKELDSAYMSGFISHEDALLEYLDSMESRVAQKMPTIKAPKIPKAPKAPKVPKPKKMPGAPKNIGKQFLKGPKDPSKSKQFKIPKPPKIASDLMAKVNEEVKSLKAKGVDEVDIKQAIFKKYGPDISNAMFEKTASISLYKGYGLDSQENFHEFDEAPVKNISRESFGDVTEWTFDMASGWVPLQPGNPTEWITITSPEEPELVAVLETEDENPLEHAIVPPPGQEATDTPGLLQMPISPKKKLMSNKVATTPEVLSTQEEWESALEAEWDEEKLKKEVQNMYELYMKPEEVFRHLYSRGCPKDMALRGADMLQRVLNRVK